jgi:hypothetical protein
VRQELERDLLPKPPGQFRPQNAGLLHMPLGHEGISEADDEADPFARAAKVEYC